MNPNSIFNPVSIRAGKHLKSLADMQPDIRSLDEEYTLGDSVSAGSFDVTEDTAIFGTNRHSLGEDTLLRLLGDAGAPTSYLDKMGLPLRILAIRQHIGRGDLGQTITPVFRRGQLITLQNSRLVGLTNGEVMSAITDSIGAEAGSLMVTKVESFDDRLALDLVSPLKAIEPRKGDVVQAGLHVEHSRFGGGATQIHGFNYRLVCLNGMMRRECVSAEGIVRTRKLPADHPNAKEMTLDQIRRLTARTWQNLGHQLAEFRTTTARRADAPQLLRQWFQRARMSTRVTDVGSEKKRTVMDRLLLAWREHNGGEETVYGAVNALTWVATHDEELSARQRRALSLLAGLLAFSGAHICPRCFSVLHDPGTSDDQTT